MILTAMLGAVVLFPPQDAAAEKDPARALYERAIKRFAKAPALHLEASLTMSMALPGMEEEQDLGTFELTGQLAKPMYGSMAIEGKISFMGQNQEMSMEMVADGETVYQLDHQQQTAMDMGGDWGMVFEPPFGFDMLAARAKLDLPAFDEIAFAEADEAHAGLTGLVLETESSRRVIWFDAKENLKEYHFRSTDADAMEPTTLIKFRSVELPKEVDAKSYKRTVPEGYETMDLGDLGYVEEEVVEGEDDGVPPYAKDLLPVGAEAPDVTFIGMDDAKYTLSSLRGKTVLLNFWFYH